MSACVVLLDKGRHGAFVLGDFLVKGFLVGLGIQVLGECLMLIVCGVRSSHRCPENPLQRHWTLSS
jgi:hypothetical protein